MLIVVSVEPSAVYILLVLQLERSRVKKAFVLLPLIAGILFGSAGVFVRTLNAAGWDNVTVFFARALFASACMLVFLLITNREMLKIQLKDLPVFIGTGLIGMLGLNLCYNESMGLLPLSLAAVLLCTAPVFVLIIAAIVFRERITLRKAGCMVLALVGCVLVTGLLEHGVGMASPIGIALGAGSAVFYALYSIFSRIGTDRGYHTYTIVFYSVLLVTIVLFPFADHGQIVAFVGAAPAPNLAFLIAHALCLAVLPYIFITLGLQHVEAGTLSIIASGSEPAAAAVFGLLVYNEVPTVLMLVGIIVVIVALALLCVQPKPRE